VYLNQHMYDEIYIGAGLSHLIRLWLGAGESSKRILVLDDGSAEDRALSFWLPEELLWDFPYYRAWSRVEFRYGDKSERRVLSRFIYAYGQHVQIRSKLKEHVLRKSPQVEFLNAEVQKVVRRKNRFVLSTSQGEFVARNIYDSVGVNRKRERFYSISGIEAVVKTSRPAFLVSHVLMYDVINPQDKPFWYVLPLDSQRAVIESACFQASGNSLQDMFSKDKLYEYLFVRYGMERHEVEVLQFAVKEVPIFQPLVSQWKRYRYSGAVGGLVSPMTGFGVSRMIEYARGKRFHRSMELRFGVAFLKMQNTHPEGFHDFLFAFFRTFSGDQVVRFMDGMFDVKTLWCVGLKVGFRRVWRLMRFL
jgi:hypothetical protein